MQKYRKLICAPDLDFPEKLNNSLCDVIIIYIITFINIIERVIFGRRNIKADSK